MRTVTASQAPLSLAVPCITPGQTQHTSSPVAVAVRGTAGVTYTMTSTILTGYLQRKYSSQAGKQMPVMPSIAVKPSKGMCSCFTATN
jgi:hypothetical protein